MILAILSNAAMASAVLDPGDPLYTPTIDFDYNYKDEFDVDVPGLSGSESFTIESVGALPLDWEATVNALIANNDTSSLLPNGVGDDCSKSGSGWWSPYCWSGTWKTGDGASGTYYSWADKDNGANTVTQRVLFVESSIDTEFLGFTDVPETGPPAGRVPGIMSGSIFIEHSFPTYSLYTGTWVEPAAGTVVASTSTASGTPGRGGSRR